MRRQQAFSWAVMTFDGSMHAIKGAPPTITMRAKIPILPILFICLNQLECTHPRPSDASYFPQASLKSPSPRLRCREGVHFLFQVCHDAECSPGLAFFVAVTESTVSLLPFRCPVIVARPPANLSISARGPSRT